MIIIKLISFYKNKNILPLSLFKGWVCNLQAQWEMI